MSTPPHHAANTWRDFFIHIVTIVVGLQIAVGLEQNVELIHRHHERNHLSEGLLGENEKMLHDRDLSRYTIGRGIMTTLSCSKATGRIPTNPSINLFALPPIEMPLS
jgi:hypothetical protein